MDTRVKEMETRETAPLRLELGADGELICWLGEKRHRANLKPCFPWSAPHRFISVRDGEQNELALIEELDRLDPASKEAVEIMLVRARFVFEITRIDSAEAEFELRQWKVNTRQGPRRFQTKLDHWPRPLAGGGFLLRDIVGDLYFIGDPQELDGRSRKILWAFVD